MNDAIRFGTPKPLPLVGSSLKIAVCDSNDQCLRELLDALHTLATTPRCTRFPFCSASSAHVDQRHVRPQYQTTQSGPGELDFSVCNLTPVLPCNFGITRHINGAQCHQPRGPSRRTPSHHHRRSGIATGFQAVVQALEHWLTSKGTVSRADGQGIFGLSSPKSALMPLVAASGEVGRNWHPCCRTGATRRGRCPVTYQIGAPGWDRTSNPCLRRASRTGMVAGSAQQNQGLTLP